MNVLFFTFCPEWKYAEANQFGILFVIAYHSNWWVVCKQQTILTQNNFFSCERPKIWFRRLSADERPTTFRWSKWKIIAQEHNILFSFALEFFNFQFNDLYNVLTNCICLVQISYCLQECYEKFVRSNQNQKKRKKKFSQQNLLSFVLTWYLNEDYKDTLTLREQW